MKIKKRYVIVILIVLIIAAVVVSKNKNRSNDENELQILSPVIGNIKTGFSTNGLILPKNRLEVKPPVNGRIEEVLVKEGAQVNAGDVLALMSSMERAALLDAARGQGSESVNYWQEVYKAIPLTAPIEGEVIVGTVQPGQTITTSDAVVVLSDRLIVRAQVDETDIGKVKEGQTAIVSLDAYPDVKLNASVDHIYYESKTINNVTMYEVDLLPEKIPPFFRSGMNANIEFIVESKNDILLMPLNAVNKDQQGSFVMLSLRINKSNKGKGVRRSVTTGISDDRNIEVLSGLSIDDQVLVTTEKYRMPQNSEGGTNPFMPRRRR